MRKSRSRRARRQSARRRKAASAARGRTRRRAAKPRRRTALAARKAHRRKPRAAARRRGTRAAARRPAARPSRKVARPERGPRTRRAPTRPRLRVIARKKRAPSRAPTAPAFPQRAGASAKQLVLFEMVRARAVVHGAILGLPAGAAEQPLAPGKWTVKETLLHLVTRDQARLREMEAALRGLTPSWQGVRDPEMAPVNAETLAPLRHLDWEESVRLLHRTRQQLMEELEMVPEEPAEVWGREHPFGWMFHGLPRHDRHHAEIVKRWRAGRGV